jgi:hypothetical protein
LILDATATPSLAGLRRSRTITFKNCPHLEVTTSGALAADPQALQVARHGVEPSTRQKRVRTQPNCSPRRVERILWTHCHALRLHRMLHSTVQQRGFRDTGLRVERTVH